MATVKYRLRSAGLLSQHSCVLWVWITYEYEYLLKHPALRTHTLAYHSHNELNMAQETMSENRGRDQTHFRSHSFRSASNAAGLLGLDGLPLRQVMRSVLLIFSVIGQGGSLQREVCKCEDSDTKHGTTLTKN